MAQEAIPAQAWGRYNRVIQYNEPAKAGFFNTPLSNTENLDLGLMAGEPGQYSFNPFTSAVGSTTRIDWRGQVAGKQVVLRWQGPNGRYRQFGGNVGGRRSSTTIYRNGRIEAVGPANVIAAAVTTEYTDPTFGTGPLLQIVVLNISNGFFDVYRKPFGLGDSDPGLFEPTLRPNGWKHIGSPSYPTDADISRFVNKHDVMFFNESGTKARAMIQVTTPLIGDTPQDDSRYMEYEISISSDFAIGSSLGLNGGYIFEDTTLKNCEASRASQSPSTLNSTSSEDITLVTRNFVDDNKLFVDFKGDVPVYARTIRTSSARQINVLTESTCPAGTTNVSSSTSESENSQFIGTIERERIILDISGQQLISGDTRIGTGSGSNSGDITAVCTGSTFRATTDDRRFLRLKYADMRYDVVVWAEQEDINSVLLSGNGSGPFGATYPVSETKTFTDTEKFTIAIAGQVHELYNEQVETVQVAVLNSNVCGTCGPGCCTPQAPFPSSCNETFDNSQPDNAVFTPLNQFDNTNDDVGGLNVDVDFDGDVAYFSERPLADWFATLDVSPDFTNFLTGGDPVAITGLTGSNPRFSGIRLMR